MSGNTPVRTLRIWPIQHDMNGEIKKYFEKFGAVNCVEVKQENDSHALYGMVEFKTVDTTAIVLSKGIHHIDGCEVQVKAAEPWNQPDQILNALNNDCLQKIFSYLNLHDLIRAANVCVQFNELAKMAFSSSSKNLDLTRCNYKETKSSLENFGSMAQSIHIVRSNSWRGSILSLIDQFCTLMLKELTLTGFRFGKKLGYFEDPAPEEPLLFHFSLERLYLHHCYLTQRAENLLHSCDELKILHFYNCSLDAGTYMNELKKLEELRMIKNKGYDYFQHLLDRVIASNPRLTKLYLREFEFCNLYPSRIVLTIEKHLYNLRELELDMSIYRLDSEEFEKFSMSIPNLCFLPSLKVLKLNLNSQSARFLAMMLQSEGTPIEHMRLSHGIINTECVEYISQMKDLKVVELNEITGLTDGDMFDLAKGLGHQLEILRLEGSTAVNITMCGLKYMLQFATKLNKLTLDSTDITIDVNDYESMLSILKYRLDNVKFLYEEEEDEDDW